MSLLDRWVANTKRVLAKDKNTGSEYEFESIFPDGAPDGTAFNSENMNKIIDAVNGLDESKGQPNGIATLNSSGKLVQMPTAADVGARPSTWMPTAADVGAIALTSEGSWTPSAVEMRGFLDGNIYTRRIGYYIKIGKLVIATFDIAVKTKSTESNWNNVTQACVRGLPGTLARQNTAYLMGARIVKSARDGNTIAATTALAYGSVALVTHDGPLNTNTLGDGFELRGSIAYIVN